jgi:hypothetical protein
MKRIKSFNLFESGTDIIPDDIRQDIMDMALELKDEGYDVTYSWEKSFRISNLIVHPNIGISKGTNATGHLEEKIYYGHIKDFCERIKSFLESEGYDAFVKFHSEDSHKYVDIEDAKVNWGPFDDAMMMSLHYRIEIIKKEQ